jgi:LmbE family N-acetylglucosaminyl deacetylase
LGEAVLKQPSATHRNARCVFFAAILATGCGSQDRPNAYLSLRSSAFTAPTGYAVDLPASVVAGQAVTVRVTARDASGATVTNYSGTVHFESQDYMATLPADYTFKSADLGTRTFSVTYRMSGSWYLRVNEIGWAISGTASTTVSPGPLNNYVTELAYNQTVGVRATFNLTAQDAFGNTATTYAGSAVITSQDPNATLPPNPRFVSGVANAIPITFGSAGGWLVSSNDTVNPAIGDSAPVSVNAAPLSNITTVSSTVAGTAGLAASVPLQTGATYAWSIGNGVITAGSGTNSITYSASAAGTLTLQCVVTSSAGVSTTGNASVSVSAYSAAITAPSAATTGATGLAASVQSLSGASYAWTISGGTVTAGAGTPSITFTAGAVGALSLTCVVTPAVSGPVTTGTRTVNVVAPPAAPTITAPATIVQNASGTASITARAGMTYQWTVAGGTITSAGGASGVTSGTTNSITFTAGAPPTLNLSCVEINAAGSTSAPGSATATITSAPTPPTITAANPVTANATGLTASVAARSGMSYVWTISGGAITSSGGTAGVTSGGINSIAYTAGAVGTLTLTCAESDGRTTSAATTATISVIAPPATPAISTASPAYAGTTGRTAAVTARAGMTYRWTITNGTITSPGDGAGVMVGGSNQLTFTVGSAGTMTLTCAEVNAAGTSSAAASVAVTVLAGRPPSRELYIVAHQDDDLLFMNPDIETGILAGRTVRTVYTTAGDAGNPASYWLAREDGVRAAYSAMAGVANTWQCATKMYLGTKSTVLCTLTAQPQVSLLFMRIYSENQAGLSATSTNGLLALWNRPGPYLISVNSANTTDGTTTYTRADLINTLAAIMNDFSPTRIGTLDDSQIYGPANGSYDHNDHISSAFFAFEATHAYGQPHDLRLYRGYNTYIDPNGGWTGSPQPESPNLSQAEHDEKVRVFNAYSLASGNGPIQPNDGYDRWVWRRFGFIRLTRGSGAFVEPGGNCLDTGGSTATGAPAQISACVSGSQQQQWTLTSNETLVGPAGKCLTLASDGISVVLSDCVGSAQQKWTSFSTGQLRGREGGCLSVPTGSSQLQMLDCDSDRSSALPGWIAPASQRWVQTFSNSRTWSVGQQFSDADLGTTTSYYRTFQLADVNGDGYGDACVRRFDGVYCALNNSSGSFASYALYSSAFADVAGFGADATGTTLRTGDVNADGRADVCARSSSGIVCATANAAGTSFVNARVWSSGNDFSDAAGWAASPSYYQSIRLADVNGDGYADVCGRLADGIYCALNNRNGGFSPATLWLADFTDAGGWSNVSYGTTLQFADINGDGKADVCGRGSAGIRCAVANSAGTGFINARIWSWRNDFSDAASWNTAVSYYGSIRLTDVNGDGLADVCGRGPQGIVCAFNNGLAFDHTTPILPVSFTDALGWRPDRYGSTISFGDLANRGRADVCGRSVSDLQCSLAP